MNIKVFKSLKGNILNIEIVKNNKKFICYFI